VRWEFHDLPARPMIRRELSVDGLAPNDLQAAVRIIVESVPEDAVLSIRLTGALTVEHWRVLSAPRLRTFVPGTMNVEIAGIGRYRRPDIAREVTQRKQQEIFSEA